MKKAIVSLLLCVAASCAVSAVSAQDEVSAYPCSKGENIVRVRLGYCRPEKSGGAKAFGIRESIKAGKYVIDRLYVDGGLGFTTASSWYGSGSERFSDSNSTIQVPVSAGYTLPLGDRMALDFSTGPCLNYIVSGKQEMYGEKIKYKDIEGLERFSVAWDIEAAVCIYGFGLYVGYDMGLKKDSGNIISIGLRIGW